MRIAVLRDPRATERRVAIVPESLKRLRAKKIDVIVERGAGDRAAVTDADYEREQQP